MELRDFAEQVLFATNLEEKLRCPDDMTDARPGSPLVAPEAPGRPPGLRFKSQGSGKADFPGVHRLGQERERGRLLHFFANHELLATELMALVLLRFPEAPAAFRRGVWQTLKDEQLHTRLYLERMRECGIQFGELPVSGYFWRALAPMANPMDYVAGLSLTFEQANLDFARHFARGFAAVGDAETARLLEKIYHDEIGHVAYGLKWFRRWKNPGQSDWEAFCEQLKFPLSPQRAKGISLNIEGRRAAGLEAAFIAELNVYSQSKGRTPSVFVFNPLAEGRIAHGKQFTPIQHQALLARDLANLPQFLCGQDDVVLVEKRPAIEFLSGLQQAGFPLPEFVELDRPLVQSSETLPMKLKVGRVAPRAPSPDAGGGGAHGMTRPTADTGTCSPCGRQAAGRLPTNAAIDRQVLDHASPLARSSIGDSAGAAGLSTLAHRKLGRLRPWAWGPDSVELLEPLFAKLTGEKRSASQSFNERIAQLYSKAWSAALLRKLLARIRADEARHLKSEIRNPKSEVERGLVAPADAEPWLCTEHEVGVAVDTLEDALEAIAAIRRRAQHKVVVKEALGLAGQNAIRLWEPELLETQRRWIVNRNHRQLVIEPWLERELDFSVQLEMTSGGLKICGYTGLINDRKGQFLGNWAAANYDRRIPTRAAALLGEPARVAYQLQSLYAGLFTLLEEELRHADYLGPVGIDAFVYRTPQGRGRLKPIVEINPRYTMGRLTVELMKQTCPGSHGLFRLVNRTAAHRLGFDDFAAYARALSERFPLRLEGEPVPKIHEGALCLNDPAQAQVCLAVFQVSRNLDALISEGGAK